MKRAKNTSGLTIVEMLIAAAVGSMALAAAFSASISMQRCLAAGQEYAVDKGEQSRLSDYLALDLRRALTYVGPNGNEILTVTMPSYYDAGGNPITPTIDNVEGTYVLKYGATPTTVVYRKYGSTITRTENGGTPLIVAQNVEDFECAIDEVGTKNVVHTRVSFVPHFRRGEPGAAARAATTVHNMVRLRNKAQE